MGRYFGGVFGNTLASDVGLDVAKGVFTLSDHYYSKAEGGWSVPLGASGNPYTSWTSLNAQGFTNTTKYLQLAGNTYNIQIDDSGYAFIAHQTGDNIHIANLINPSNPTYQGSFNNLGSNCHDIYTRDNIAYISEGYSNRFAIYDISNLNNISNPLAIIPCEGY